MLIVKKICIFFKDCTNSKLKLKDNIKIYHIFILYTYIYVNFLFVHIFIFYVNMLINIKLIQNKILL